MTIENQLSKMTKAQLTNVGIVQLKFFASNVKKAQMVKTLLKSTTQKDIDESKVELDIVNMTPTDWLEFNFPELR
jgi:hypothetical protein